MEVLNPCLTANFVQTIAVTTLTTTVGAAAVGTQYEIPTDTVSSLFGNGYDMCGDRIHYLEDSTSSRIYPRIGDFDSSTF